MNIQVNMPPKEELKWASDYPPVPPGSKDKIIAELKFRIDTVEAMLRIMLEYIEDSGKLAP